VNAAFGYVARSLFPELCLGCGERLMRDDFFCANCTTTKPVRATAPDSGAHGFRQRFVFDYEGNARKLLAAAKFSERRRAVRVLVRAATEDFAPLTGKGSVFIALPSRRRFLHALLKKSLPQESIRTDIFRMKKRLFKRTANKELGEGERFRRIRDDLLWAERTLPAVERYIICDDVFTTGATLTHAAHLLQTRLIIPKEKIVLWALMVRPRKFARDES